MDSESRIEKAQIRWGLTLADISRATAMNMTYVRAWKAGHDDHVTAEQLQRLGDLEVFLAEAHEAGEHDPVAWLEDPLVDGCQITGWDLYLEAETRALLDIINGDPADEILDDTIADWRTRYGGQFDAYEDDDASVISYRY